MSLRGHVDCGRGRAHYAFVDLATELQWDQYRRLAKKTSVACLEVVVDISGSTARNDGLREEVDIANDSLAKETIEMEQRESSDDHFGVGMARNHFPDDTFEREEAEMNDDDISEGSEGGNDGGAN
ncbi:hypothetical protein HU200_052655 [Digitaria exilis]|uniref:Uncharacterized protein n=1 Tax=Digitaria exilis TaxID=1010633 RepID=A0A835ATM5_9POAL|nr:hypothetical protein HU200_052655 [Digitaria exilis]